MKTIERQSLRFVLLALLVTAGLALPRAAFANMIIVSDTTLTSSVFGQIYIGHDDVTLDCNGHWIYWTDGLSANPNNCQDSGYWKDCAIRAVGHRNVTITNCNIWGPFNYGVYVMDGENVNVFSTQTYTSNGFYFRNVTNDSTLSGNLAYGGGNNTGVGFAVLNATGGTFIHDNEARSFHTGFSEFFGNGTAWLVNSARDNRWGAGYFMFFANASSHNGDQAIESANYGFWLYGVNSSEFHDLFLQSSIPSYGISVESSSFNRFVSTVSINQYCAAYQDSASVNNFWTGSFFSGGTCGDNPPPG